jgi:hypothetical protein
MHHKYIEVQFVGYLLIVGLIIARMIEHIKMPTIIWLTFWLRDAPTSLTFNNGTVCPHCIYVFCKQRLVPLTA